MNKLLLKIIFTLNKCISQVVGEKKKFFGLICFHVLITKLLSPSLYLFHVFIKILYLKQDSKGGSRVKYFVCFMVNRF